MERETEGLKRKGKGRERKGGSEQEREGKGGSWLRKTGMGWSELEEEREPNLREGGFFSQLAFVPNRQYRYPRMQRMRAGTKSTYLYNCMCTIVAQPHFVPVPRYQGRKCEIPTRVSGYLRQNRCSQDLQNHTDSQSRPISMSEHVVPDSELLDYNMKRPGSRGVSSRIQGNIYPYDLVVSRVPLIEL